MGRDGCRTPMQWDSGHHAGFSTADPWLPISDDYRKRNVEMQRRDPGSIFLFYRTLIALRRRYPALVQGALHSVRAENGVLTFAREYREDRIMVALNLTAEPIKIDIDLDQPGTHILLSTCHDRPMATLTGSLALAANEGVVIAA